MKKMKRETVYEYMSIIYTFFYVICLVTRNAELGMLLTLIALWLITFYLHLFFIPCEKEK